MIFIVFWSYNPEVYRHSICQSYHPLSLSSIPVSHLGTTSALFQERGRRCSRNRSVTQNGRWACTVICQLSTQPAQQKLLCDIVIRISAASSIKAQKASLFFHRIYATEALLKRLNRSRCHLSLEVELAQGTMY